MAEQVVDIIGLMDPNRFALKESLEQLLKFIDPVIKYRGQEHRITTQRLKSRPYDTLNVKTPYRAILNRGAHWNPHHNSYLTIIAPDAYLLNDMVSFFAIDKNTSYGQMAQLGLRIPPTVAIPQQDYSEFKNDPRIDVELMFEDFEMFDLTECGDEVGFPAYLKPQSGGGWSGVVRVENQADLMDAYNQSGDRPMNLQKAIAYREFARTLGVGPQMLPMHYNPNAAQSHDRYLRSTLKAVEHSFLSPAEYEEVARVTRVINAFYNWDHNTCETLIDHDGRCHAIDFANAYPDSSPVSLHYYFPTMVKMLAKWLIFVAVTGRKKPIFGADWADYFSARDRAENEGMSYMERLELYDEIACRHFALEAFEAFCAESIPDFEAQAYDFFGSDKFPPILERAVCYHFKVQSEVPSKIEHYLGIHDFWLHCELGRLKSPSLG